MKIRTHPLITPLCAAIASLVIIGSPARAGYIVTLTQAGPNVVANGSGAIDLGGLELLAIISVPVEVNPIPAVIITGPPPSLNRQTIADLYVGAGFHGPINIGNGFTEMFATSGSGDVVGLIVDPPGGYGLFVPQGYISGTALSDTATYDNATFSSLGVTPGTYEWTWGAGANQNFTLKIGATTVPDAGSTFMLLSGAIVALGNFRRRRI
jgi:hypothetical protein